MTSYTHLPTARHAALKLIALMALLCATFTPAFAQTSGGTIISNQASAVYTDSSSNNYSTVSNTVTVTVANVSGLRITPDGGSNSTVVPGQTNVGYAFTVTNTGNFADQVRFLASGQSVNVSGPGTITAAVIDNGDNLIGAGDIDILANGADVLHSLAQNASAVILVSVTVSPSATSGQSVQVLLGDAGSTVAGDGNDNQAANTSANEVRTVAATSVNGLREARGDASASVQNDVQLLAGLTVPAGPAALGSNITYGLQVCNTGNRAATATTLGAFSGIFVVAPIPIGTTLAATNAFPAGTLYTTSPLTTAPSAATWSTTAPATLSDTTRIAINTGATLAGGNTCSTSVPLILTITTANASTPIYGIVDAFAKNTINNVITDQSGDAIPGKGDGNANFNEPLFGGTVSATQGFQLPTLLEAVGSVLIGPSGQPGATGPGGSNNTDFTNRSVTTGIAGIPPCAAGQTPACSTDASGQIVFTNTVRNTGNANDTFTLTAPTVPAGFTVEISTNGGTSYTTVSGGGSTTLSVAYDSTANILVRVTAPAGQQILTGFATVIEAASLNTPASTNQTIDRLYTGFVRLDKAVNVFDANGAPADNIPGSIIEYVITYTNVMTAPAAGSGSSSLTATNLVISEDGAAGGNNWASFTTQVTTPAPADSTIGVITDGNGGAVTSLTNFLKDSIATLAPGASGTFRFRRLIN